MMEIKFRGKRLDDGEWVYGYYIFLEGIHFITTENAENNYGDLNGFYEVNPKTVGQYTGENDKNVIEAYVDSIIKINELTDDGLLKEYICPIVLQEDKLEAVAHYKKGGEDWYLPVSLLNVVNGYPQSDFEVIGNIHDNPELLEVQE